MSMKNPGLHHDIETLDQQLAELLKDFDPSKDDVTPIIQAHAACIAHLSGRLEKVIMLVEMQEEAIEALQKKIDKLSAGK